MLIKYFSKAEVVFQILIMTSKKYSGIFYSFTKYSILKYLLLKSNFLMHENNNNDNKKTVKEPNGLIKTI